MPKVKIPKKSVSIDMTPMVDMAFLLVTFFMLTTKFTADEPIKISNPSSTSTITVPDKDKTQIEISDDGRVFFNFDGKYTRQTLIQNMGKQYKIDFTQDEINTFAILGMMGVPMNEMKAYLNTESDKRKSFPQRGIPIDSTNNELTMWLSYSRAANPNSTILIKADDVAKFKVANRVIDILQDQGINRFYLITDKEEPPAQK
jgi:biopolymer transport protein ExbD